jgi:hypothetical protein
VVTLEDSGIPTANVATTEFMGAAQAQCSALGLPQYQPIFVAHPIQPKTPDEVRVLVDQVIDQIVGKLLTQKVQQAA